MLTTKPTIVISVQIENFGKKVKFIGIIENRRQNVVRSHS